MNRLEKARQHLKTRGPWWTARWAVLSLFYYPVVRWVDTRFDRKYGTETATDIYPRDFLADPEVVAHANEYSPTPDRIFLRFLRRQRLDFARYTFIDLGCGKGRALLLASLFPFRRVIGVELEPRIHEVCVRNIDAFTRKAKLSRRPEALCMSAGEFEFPEGDILLYLFNPFDEHIMTQVAANLRRSLAARPRHVRIIYFHPNWEAPLMQLPNVRLLCSESFRDRKALGNVSRVNVYDIAPLAGCQANTPSRAASDLSASPHR